MLNVWKSYILAVDVFSWEFMFHHSNKQILQIFEDDHHYQMKL